MFPLDDVIMIFCKFPSSTLGQPYDYAGAGGLVIMDMDTIVVFRNHFPLSVSSPNNVYWLISQNNQLPAV